MSKEKLYDQYIGEFGVWKLGGCLSPSEPLLLAGGVVADFDLKSEVLAESNSIIIELT